VTSGDLARIEQALGVVLPESYRARVAPYPIPAAAGNADLGVWDDPDELVRYNLELRGGAPGGVKPWPPHFFALGHAGDGCPRALDLRAGDAVWWVDHGHLDHPATHREADSFAAWADSYFATLRQEMAGEMVDPDGTPAQRAAAEAKGARESAIGCLLLAALVGAAVLAVKWLWR
jgi:hypothetical protein